MSNVAEFIEIRQQIESLVKQIVALIGQKSAPQSKVMFDQAKAFLEKLTAMADNDVQEIAVGRLTRVLAGLESKVAVPPAKKRAAKKQPTP